MHLGIADGIRLRAIQHAGVGAGVGPLGSAGGGVVEVGRPAGRVPVGRPHPPLQRERLSALQRSCTPQHLRSAGPQDALLVLWLAICSGWAQNGACGRPCLDDPVRRALAAEKASAGSDTAEARRSAARGNVHGSSQPAGEPHSRALLVCHAPRRAGGRPQSFRPQRLSALSRAGTCARQFSAQTFVPLAAPRVRAPLDPVVDHLGAKALLLNKMRATGLRRSWPCDWWEQFSETPTPSPTCGEVGSAAAAPARLCQAGRKKHSPVIGLSSPRPNRAVTRTRRCLRCGCLMACGQASGGDSRRRGPGGTPRSWPRAALSGAFGRTCLLVSI